MMFAEKQQVPAVAALLCAGFAGSFLFMGVRMTVRNPHEAASSSAEQFIETAERQWAEALSTGDTKAVEPFLAADLTGTDPTGKAFDKAGMLSVVRDGPNLFVSDRINTIQVTLHGDTAVAQGDETWEMRVGDRKHGRFLFTDTWIRRGDQWQVVASYSSLAPE